MIDTESNELQNKLRIQLCLINIYIIVISFAFVNLLNSKSRNIYLIIENIKLLSKLVKSLNNQYYEFESKGLLFNIEVNNLNQFLFNLKQVDYFNEFEFIQDIINNNKIASIIEDNICLDINKIRIQLFFKFWEKTNNLQESNSKSVINEYLNFLESIIISHKVIKSL